MPRAKMAATISILSEESPLRIGFTLSVACQLVHRLDALGAALLADDLAVLDAQHAVGKRNGSGIVSDCQHGATRVLGDLGEELHHRDPVLAIERRRGLVRQHDRGGAHQGGEATATRCCSPPLKLDGYDLSLWRRPTCCSARLRAHDRIRAALAAYIEGNAHILLGRQRGKQVVGLEDETDVPAAQPGKLLRRKALRGMPGNGQASPRSE